MMRTDLSPSVSNRTHRLPAITVTHLAISGFSLHTPSVRITKSAGSNTCPLTNFTIARAEDLA